MDKEFITLGAGCFWCTEAVYQQVRGVGSVVPGYCNGLQPQRPSYEQVCTGRTGYVEVARIGFDPAVIGLREILEIFFTIHDPTSLNRQGADVGTQYRSGIYVENDAQRDLALEMIAQIDASGALPGPVVTEVESLRNFWPAEDYHHDYFARHPQQGYCAVVIGPKVEKFRRTFAQFVKRTS
ncbi:peptide methionine sulfoxide reductase [Lampropedia cohaerens]|uniref:Peptide methionine sulfoxide reductase MsrA n=1 Tax=Lampropedia cohaerens TaxID=1610491 RepID=A0A0U1Q3J5_9BURK|nr:peptide-methionine (S)-S-oxide reductase MsrA [Lampropedia cohaerens]KKW69316.1 peptide methionine sulfoxide reductase [Lampropedia cohaerens]